MSLMESFAISSKDSLLSWLTTLSTKEALPGEMLCFAARSFSSVSSEIVWARIAPSMEKAFSSVPTSADRRFCNSAAFSGLPLSTEIKMEFFRSLM